MLIVNRRIQIPLDEFRYTFARSSGPGGQNVNKVNTKVTLHWPVEASPSVPDDVKRRFIAQNRRRINKEDELVLYSQRYRDQARNVADCLEKLRELLEQATVVPKHRKPTKPTRASKRRRLDAKKARGERKRQRRSPRMDD